MGKKKKTSAIVSLITFTTLATMGGGVWVFYTYQSGAKPLLSLDGFDGQVLEMRDGKYHLRFELKVSKTGADSTTNTEVMTTFLKVYPPPVAVDDTTYTDFPDMVKADGRPFIIDKYLSPDELMNAMKFPGYFTFFVTTRWKGASLVFARRTFSFSALYRLYPMMAKDGDKMKLKFDVRGVKGPTYSESVGWHDQKVFFKAALREILKGEDLMSLLEQH